MHLYWKTQKFLSVCKLTHPISLYTAARRGDPISANPYWILDLNLNQLFARTIPNSVYTLYITTMCHGHIFFVLFSGMRMGIYLYSPQRECTVRSWFGIERVFFAIIGHTKPVHAHTSNLFWWILFFLLSFLFLFFSNVTSSRIVVLYRYGARYIRLFALLYRTYIYIILGIIHSTLSAAFVFEICVCVLAHPNNRIKSSKFKNTRIVRFNIPSRCLKMH